MLELREKEIVYLLGIKYTKPASNWLHTKSDGLMQYCNWDDDVAQDVEDEVLKNKETNREKIKTNKPIKCLIKQGIPNAMLFVSS